MNNLLVWNDSLSTGFDEVDLQHKKLLLIIDEVNTCVQAEPAEYTLGMSKVLKKLTDYTLYHFGEEEAFMRKYNYPGFDAHRQKHEDFIDQVRLQIKTLSQENPANGFQFYRYLGTWLLTHIAKEDQAWANFIRNAR